MLPGFRAMALQSLDERAHLRALPRPDAGAKGRGAFFRSIRHAQSPAARRQTLVGKIPCARVRVEDLDEGCTGISPAASRRAKTDAEILEWVETDESASPHPLRFRGIVGNRDRSFPLWFAVQHFFNHQTHHRGQVTTLLMQAGVDPGVTDLMWLPGMEEAA